jgi:tetratricopeptide (TPR) repeat protein
MEADERRRRLGAALGYLETERWRPAEEECCALLAHDPSDIESLLVLGLTVAAMGETDRAAVVLDRVAEARPNHVHPCRDFASLRPAVSRLLVAAQYRACLALTPRSARLRRDFASFLLDHDQAAEALAILRETADGAATRHLTGIALAELGRFVQAIEAFEHAVTLDPVPAMGWSNLGMMLKVEGQYDAALAAHDQAVARSPNDANIRVNRAVALLHAGRWTEAWEDYEWRLRLPHHVAMPLDRLLPAVESLGDLRGVRVLAVHEEGFGDTLQFLRYLPLLARCGAYVIAMVPAPLMRVTQQVEGVAEVVESAASPPDYDFHCPFFSLPRAFGTTVRTIPAEPYLSADPALSEAWAARMPDDGLRVGLVWAGQARPWLPGFTTLDNRRSAGLAAFAPLAGVPGVRFVSLQAGSQAVRGQDRPRGLTLFDPMDEVTDFADTAAIIDNLEVVISVDTAVVHLAGAMGKTVFLLDRYDNCWRWLSWRADSPWYPSLTIFRQGRAGDWSGPMRQVAAALEGVVAFRGWGSIRIHKQH